MTRLTSRPFLSTVRDTCLDVVAEKSRRPVLPPQSGITDEAADGGGDKLGGARKGTTRADSTQSAVEQPVGRSTIDRRLNGRHKVGKGGDGAAGHRGLNRRRSGYDSLLFRDSHSVRLAINPPMRASN